MVKTVNVTNAASPQERQIKWRPSVDGRGGMMEIQVKERGSDDWTTVGVAHLSANQTSLLIDAIAPNALAAYRVAVQAAQVRL